MSEKSSLEKISAQISSSTIFNQSMVEAILNAYDMLSPYSAGRTRLVTSWTTCIGSILQIDEAALKELEISAMLCDVGMWAIPNHIINKKGRLTLSEFKLIQQHPTLTLNTLKALPISQAVHDNILFHHESFDGTGYPEGLEGDNIPLGAQVINVACALFALISPRPYRDPFEIDEAIEILEREKGKQFNPKVVDALKQAYSEDKIEKASESLVADPFSPIRRQIDLNFDNNW